MDTRYFSDSSFSRETIVDLDAAVVGISRAQWQALDVADATAERAITLMQQQRFDVLPIIDGRAIREYFHTTTWGDYTQIARERIARRDVIPHQTRIRDVIKGLATENQRFYFLSYEHHIVGLLSAADLNSRHVKIYLFSLLSELEVRLGQFITMQVPEAELRTLTLDSGKEKYAKTKERFDNDRASGLDAPLVEYLYLADLLSVIAKQGLFRELAYASRSQYEEQINPLNDLRHIVAHPTRSLITAGDSIAKLWRDIDRIEDLLFRLR